MHGYSVPVSTARGSRLFIGISSPTQLGRLYRLFPECKHPHSGFATTSPGAIETHLIKSLTSPHYRLPEEVYLCWRNTSYLCTEMFASSLNGPGIFCIYCSLSKKINCTLRSSVNGTNLETPFKKGAASPPFEKDFVQHVLGMFSKVI